MKHVKKISALLLALVMVMGLSVSAMAAGGDMNTQAGVIGEFQTADTPDSAYDPTVIIYQEITAYNQDSKDVNAPTIDYTYTITGLEGGVKLKDKGTAALHVSTNAVEVQTKDARTAAIGTPKISASVDSSTYVDNKLSLTPSVTLKTAPTGKVNRFPVKLDFSDINWTSAGVYRFQIDETTAAAEKVAAGIKEGTTTNKRYVDVYVKDASSGTGYEIYGYVCFTDTTTPIDGTQESTVTAAGKTEGFVGSKANNEAYDAVNDSVADRYYTFNVKVSKTLQGDQSMNDHDFPFTVTFTNDSVTKAIVIKTEASENGGTATEGALASGTLSTATTGITDNTHKIDHESYVTYVGIPVGISAGTKVDVFEINDVTGTTYLSKYKVDNGTESTPKSINWTDPSNKSDVATFTVTADAHDAVSHVVAFTNILELISPTGVALRVAPYAAMMGGSVALLAVGRRRKEEEA